MENIELSIYRKKRTRWQKHCICHRMPLENNGNMGEGVGKGRIVMRRIMEDNILDCSSHGGTHSPSHALRRRPVFGSVTLACPWHDLEVTFT